MTQCPACAQPISPNQDKCSKCGIPLHHGVDTGPRSTGTAKSTGLVIGVVVVFGLMSLMVLLCGGGFFFLSARSVAVPTPAVAPPTMIEVESAPAIEQQPAEREEQPTP